MKRRLVRWLVIATLALGMALQAGLAGAAAPERTVYLALGDSLAAGVGAVSPKAQGAYEGRVGYVPRFFHALRASTGGEPQVLTNLAVRGTTSATFISGGQLAGAVAAINDPDTDVQVVTLDIGGNDVRTLLAEDSPCVATPSKPIDPVACHQKVTAVLIAFTKNYARILDELTQALEADPGNESVLVMTYYNPFSGTGWPVEPLAETAVTSLNNLIASIGAQYAATILDVYTPFLNNALALTDIAEGDMQPNNAGHKLIAEAVMAAYTAP